jgi:hypothetical protein
MIRVMLAFCAVTGLALAFTGCSNLNFFAQGELANGDGLVVGKVQDVAVSVQARLTRLGFNVVLTQQGEAIHLTSTTKTGARFTLVLTREMTPQGEQTRIKLQWGSGYDRDAAVLILGEIMPKTGR